MPENKMDITTGKIWIVILNFSIPYLLAYFLQTLYGMADLFIIGQFSGVENTTAVSVGSQIMHMVTVVIVGLAMGATVIIGQGVGAKKRTQVSATIGNTITFFALFSVALMAAMLILSRRIVALVSTPEAAVKGTVTYLLICSVGIPFIIAYNVIGSIFRGMGDSRSPMYFIAIACGINIILDYVFIGFLNMGPAGAALGTTLAQTCSVLISLIMIRKKNMGIQIQKSDLKLEKETIGRILKIGIPIAFQDFLIQIAFIAITIFANMRGLNDAAGVGIVEKMITMLFLVPSAMLQTISALAAQNIGAGRHDRARSILKYGLMITTGWGLLIIAIIEPFAPWVIRLFSNNAQVIISGSQYLRSYVIDCVFAGIHFSFSGFFCAYGKSGISFLHNMLSMSLIRVPLSYLASVYFADTLFPMGMAAPLGSILSAVICVVAYKYLFSMKK